MPHVKRALTRFEQIAESLRERIKSGGIDHQLPTRDALAAEYEVNGKTVDKAMMVLESQQVIERRRGVGVFVHAQLQGAVVNEFYFVLPGYAQALAWSNPYHRVVTHSMAHVMALSHHFSLEPRIIPICPDNNPEHLNLNLVRHLKADDHVVFLGTQYLSVIRMLAQRGVRCMTIHSGGDLEFQQFRKLPVLMLDIAFDRLAQAVFTHAARAGCSSLGIAAAQAYASSNLAGLIAHHVARSDINRHGMAFNKTRQIVPLGSLDELPANIHRLLDSRPQVDALLTFNHHEAQIALRTLEGRKAAGGKPIHVFCYDTMQHFDAAQRGLHLLHHPTQACFSKALEIAAGKARFEPGVMQFDPLYTPPAAS